MHRRRAADARPDRRRGDWPAWLVTGVGWGVRSAELLAWCHV